MTNQQETQENNEQLPESIPYARFKEVNDKKKELETQLAQMTSKLEKTEKEREDYRKLADETKVEFTKESIANKYKLPPELAKRLVGTTEEELEADAKALSKLVDVSNPGVPDTPREATTTEVPKNEFDAVKGIISNIRTNK